MGRDQLTTLREWLPALATFAGLAAGGAVLQTRQGQAEARMTVIEARLDKTASSASVSALDTKISGVQDTLGDVQIMLAKLCVSQLGLEKCR